MAGRIEREKRIKQIMRRQGLLKREKQTPTAIRRKSRQIKQKLFRMPEYRQAKTVMFYAAKFGEVETGEMIKETLKKKKKAAVPKVKKTGLIPSELLDWAKDLKKGAFGIKEPMDEALRPLALEKIDLVIVPGICFDIKKNRLGYGYGYYDCFLARLPKRAKLFGLAFELQLVGGIPSFANDKSLDKIITEKRVIE
ncbi:MAG: 5-formyltetrahydrofolate cyclo-ligase [Candidatus Ratteibacteria bacterium]|nr:5-formyltetrahydrofolate cyclo-ligase [Candidatus Ratteibacteria bacterium]